MFIGTEGRILNDAFQAKMNLEQASKGSGSLPKPNELWSFGQLSLSSLTWHHTPAMPSRGSRPLTPVLRQCVNPHFQPVAFDMEFKRGVKYLHANCCMNGVHVHKQYLMIGGLVFGCLHYAFQTWQNGRYKAPLSAFHWMPALAERLWCEGIEFIAFIAEQPR